MRSKSNSDRPWYIYKCGVCRKLKHMTEFRHRRAPTGHLLTCRECQETERSGVQLSLNGK